MGRARWAAGWGPSRCDGPRRVQRREPFVLLHSHAYRKCDRMPGVPRRCRRSAAAAQRPYLAAQPLTWISMENSVTLGLSPALVHAALTEALFGLHSGGLTLSI